MLGSITHVTWEDGEVVESVDYDVYGWPTFRDGNGQIISESAIGNNLTYTAREWDQELGLYYYRSRTYDAYTGRFLQRDPLGYVDGANLCSYSGSSPTSGGDPLGLKKKKKGVSKLRDDDLAYTQSSQMSSSSDQQWTLSKRNLYEVEYTGDEVVLTFYVCFHSVYERSDLPSGLPKKVLNQWDETLHDQSVSGDYGIKRRFPGPEGEGSPIPEAWAEYLTALYKSMIKEAVCGYWGQLGLEDRDGNKLPVRVEIVEVAETDPRAMNIYIVWSAGMSNSYCQWGGKEPGIMILALNPWDYLAEANDECGSFVASKYAVHEFGHALGIHRHSGDIMGANPGLSDGYTTRNDLTFSTGISDKQVKSIFGKHRKVLPRGYCGVWNGGPFPLLGGVQ
jgi:RHS repeat-associated protein